MPEERLLAANLRSFEGIPISGGHIAGGQLWRSDNITISPDEQLRKLYHHGLRTVVDLRAPDEVQLTGTDVLRRNGILHVHRPMTRRSADPATLALTFNSVKSYNDVGEWYLRLARARARVLLGCLRDIAAAEGGVLFYCTAGKDRTGVLAAVLLLLLGAENEVVIEDYARSGTSVDRVHLRHAAVTGRPMPSTEFPDHPILHSHPKSMVAFLQGIHAGGGVERFLAKAAAAGGHGGTPAEVTALAGGLREKLVAPRQPGWSCWRRDGRQ